jgi:hypothetical protein
VSHLFAAGLCCVNHVQAAADGTKGPIHPSLKLTHALQQAILQGSPQLKPQRRLLLLLLLGCVPSTSAAAAAGGCGWQLKVPRRRLLLLLLEQEGACRRCC